MRACTGVRLVTAALCLACMLSYIICGHPFIIVHQTHVYQ